MFSFIASFLNNETHAEWFNEHKGKSYFAELDKFLPDVQRTQRKLIALEEQMKMTIAEIKEVNRRMSIGEAKARRAKKEMVDKVQLWKRDNMAGLKLWTGIAMIIIGILIFFI